MCRCTAQPNAVRSRVEIFAEAVVVFALAWLEKNNINNNNNNNQKEDEHSVVLVSWRLNEHVAYKRWGPRAEVIIVTSKIDKIDKDGKFFPLSNRPF